MKNFFVHDLVVHQNSGNEHCTGSSQQLALATWKKPFTKTCRQLLTQEGRTRK